MLAPEIHYYIIPQYWRLFITRSRFLALVFLIQASLEVVLPFYSNAAELMSIFSRQMIILWNDKRFLNFR